MSISNASSRVVFVHQSMKNTNPVAVGDHVIFEVNRSGYRDYYQEFTERKNYIIRKSTNLSRESQIMAANIDQVMLMFTLDFPETPLEFVDRFLVSAEAYHIPCILLINKTDLYSTDKIKWLEEVKKMYAYAGYTVIDISVTRKSTSTRYWNMMQHKLTLIAGNSGVGKSSLINLLCPGLAFENK